MVISKVGLEVWSGVFNNLSLYNSIYSYFFNELVRGKCDWFIYYVSVVILDSQCLRDDVFQV